MCKKAFRIRHQPFSRRFYSGVCTNYNLAKPHEPGGRTNWSLGDNPRQLCRILTKVLNFEQNRRRFITRSYAKAPAFETQRVLRSEFDTPHFRGNWAKIREIRVSTQASRVQLPRSTGYFWAATSLDTGPDLTVIEPAIA